jgi:hypothetical protein
MKIKMSSYQRALILALAVIPWKAISSPMPTPLSATWLHYACKESEASDFSRGFCNGAIEASYSAIRDWCVPEHVTRGEVQTQIKIDLLKVEPSFSVTALKFVSNSIENKWPCSKITK